MQTLSVSRSVQILFLFFLIIAGLYFARPFLIPIAFAGILAMLLVPLTRKLEERRLHKGLAAFLPIVLLLVVFSAIIALLSWQVADLASDLTQIEEKINSAIQQLKQYLSTSLGISEDKQKQLIKQQQSQGSGNMGKVVATIMSSLMSGLVDFILVLVYIFLFIYFRDHLKKFILRLTPKENNSKTQKVIHDAQKVAFNYVSGLAMMIVALWILYGIGFSVVGVKHAIFFAILCGLLEIIPFVGNLTGTSLTILMVLTQGGGTNMVIGVVITYALVQFIQTYLLEPLVVGAEVNINPLFTILVIVAGELIWGVPGMILSLPILGIIKIICDHAPPLQPYGFLIGEEKKAKGKPHWLEKIKNRFKN